MNLAAIRAALKAALQDTGWRVYATPAAKLEPPCLVIALGEPWIEYQTTMGTAPVTSLRFEILATTTTSDVDSAYARLDALASAGTGEERSLVDAVYADRTLGGVVSSVVVQSVSSITPTPMPDSDLLYLSATFSLVVTTTRS